MERMRQPIPAGLAEMPPGQELAAVLAEVDPSRLGGLDCVTVMRARHRQAAHEQARFMAAMVEVALCGVGPDDSLPRMAQPDEFSADEIRGALAWIRAAANSQLSLAWDLIHRLPTVFGALDAGSIDVPRTKVFSEWTHGLTDHQAQEICERLLPEAARLTTGQLIERIKKMAIAIDPDWARRRYEEAVRDRKVVGYRNEDGSANLCGYSLPADRAAAACTHIDTLARKVKHAGDGRPIDHLRADLYLAMLDRSYAGWTEQDIITHSLTTARAKLNDAGPDDAAEHANVDTAGGRPDGSNRVGSGPRRAVLSGGHGDDLRSRTGRESGGEVVEGAGSHQADTQPADLQVRRAGVEIRAKITTLLEIDRHPAEIAGWGPVDAETARKVVFDQTAAEWRYAIAGRDGRLLYEGITRHRPDGYPTRAAAACRGGIVELHIPLRTLRRLAGRPGRLGGWATVIADLARQADQQQQRDGAPVARPGGPAQAAPHSRGARSPGVPLRRRTQIRDRTCTGPGCRVPACQTDGDHTQDWAGGGPTTDGNIASACRHDHRLKHEGGWRVRQPRPGHVIWTSRLGVHYTVRPPLIIEPLPDPIPRDPLPIDQLADTADQSDQDAPTWRELDPPTPEHPPPRVDPYPDIPPF